MKMKKGLLTMLALLSMGSVFAQDFTVPDARVVTARKGVLQVKLTSETTYRDLQFDLALPTGISLVTEAASPESPDVTNVKAGAEGHVIAYNAVEDGKVRFAVYDPNEGKTFTTDVLIEIPVQASEEFTADAVAHVSGLVASDADAKSLAKDNFDFNIIMNLLGDVNEDGKVNVTDILAVASRIKGTSTTPFNEGAANYNNDASINVTDILGIAAIIKGGSASAKAFSVEIPIEDTLDPQ